MDKKTKLDLKDILRGAGSTAQGKLDVHGVRDDLDDGPVFDRSKQREATLRRWGFLDKLGHNDGEE